MLDFPCKPLFGRPAVRNHILFRREAVEALTAERDQP
jgi:hypothetical protein